MYSASRNIQDGTFAASKSWNKYCMRGYFAECWLCWTPYKATSRSISVCILFCPLGKVDGQFFPRGMLSECKPSPINLAGLTCSLEIRHVESKAEVESSTISPISREGCLLSMKSHYAGSEVPSMRLREKKIALDYV